MSNTKLLQKTIDEMAVHGKGILAADESTGTIGKRFASINVESTEGTRQAYRDTLFTTPGLEEYINGVILYEETLFQQSADRTPFPELLNKRGIVPGIKVDKGLVSLHQSPDEKYTQGLDGLDERLEKYKAAGARFAKWRAVFTITDTLPSMLAIQMNADNLARYAAICQAHGIVPIVEPEVLMDGNHTLERCQEVTERVFHRVFQALKLHRVTLEHIILKPSMVIAGSDSAYKPSVDDVARATVKTLKRTVPAAVPMVNFLSGGQTPIESTEHLAAMNKLCKLPWVLSFSYGRALQEPALKAWQGKSENKAAAQAALLERAKANSEASYN